MKQNSSSCPAWLSFKTGASVIGGLGLLSSSLIWTSADAATDTLIIPETAPVVAPPAVTPASAPKPIKAPEAKPISPKPELKAPVYKVSPKVIPAPQKQEISAPKIAVPQPKVQVPSPQVNLQGKNSYIDTTNYNATRPSRPTPPSAVVITERSTGCQTVVQNGQVGGGCGVATAKPQKNTPIARSSSPRTVARTAYQAPTTPVNRRQTVATATATAPATATQSLQPVRVKTQRLAPQTVVNLQPIARRGISIALAPVPQYNRSASLYASSDLQSSINSDRPTQRTDLIFPLPVIAEITSAFGWRTHPIAGVQRQHEGTDIGAPMGTPVLAAYEGQVAMADWAGGYGLMVTLRHVDGTQESRYAHLSEVYVQPGEWVEKGTVIGRVGSTGYSTGPHLHFEWRHLTEQGWVAVDAGLHLEVALDNLMRSLQFAQDTPKTQS